MTEREISVVIRSWQLFRKIDANLIGEVFYGRLFQQAPVLKSMFKIPMTAQYLKIVEMLSVIISQLGSMEELEDGLRRLAQRHVHYGVRSEHYKPVGDALLWTLKQGLGKDWTDEMDQAWTKCYALVSEKMINASRFPGA